MLLLIFNVYVFDISLLAYPFCTHYPYGLGANSSTLIFQGIRNIFLVWLFFFLDIAIQYAYYFPSVNRLDVVQITVRSVASM